MKERPNSFDKNIELVKEAGQKLGDVIDEMPDSPTGRYSKEWENTYLKFLDRDGEESVAALLPKKIRRNTNVITSGLNKLRAAGIVTQEDLLMVDASKIESIPGIGEKRGKLVKTLHDCALAKFHLDWSK